MNLACKYRQWVYCLLTNLAQISKWGLAQDPPPPKYENLLEIVILQHFCPASATQYTDLEDIKPLSIGLYFQGHPRSGSRSGSPQSPFRAIFVAAGKIWKVWPTALENMPVLAYCIWNLPF